MGDIDKKRTRIGLFDSGHGGLSVLKALSQLAPDCDYYYIADLKYAPYGDRSEQEICERARVLTELLLAQQVDLVIVACNTATAVAIDYLRREFDHPFVGIEPYLTALEHQKLDPQKDRLVALVTPAMARSQRFAMLRQRRDPQNLIHVHPCPQLARSIESTFEQRPFAALIAGGLEDLNSLKNQGFTHALLGCTHYPLIAQEIAEYLNVRPIAPCKAVAQRALTLLGLASDQRQVRELFYLNTLHENWQHKNFASLWPLA